MSDTAFPRKTAAGNWLVESSEIAYETPWLRFRSDKVRNHRNKPLTYGVVELHHTSVFIVAMNDRNEILLQREYRYSIDQYVWDVPAGFSDGQEPLVAAQRELLEETGLASTDWTHLGKYYVALGIANVAFDLFLARNVSVVTDERDEDEEIIEQRFIDIATIEAMEARGEIVSTACIASINQVRLHVAKSRTD